MLAKIPAHFAKLWSAVASSHRFGRAGESRLTYISCLTSKSGGSIAAALQSASREILYRQDNAAKPKTDNARTRITFAVSSGNKEERCTS
jgi:hypothetical protein